MLIRNLMFCSSKLTKGTNCLINQNVIRLISLKVAIVGSGPAGFYTTQKLLKNPDVNVDIYEKLPVPFGLVRYGVAPDHQDVKNVIRSFTSVASNNNNRINFYGNVSLGQDVQLEDLIEAYHAVVLCYGSAQDKLLNIEGESTTKNTISARNFVGWYNGVPEDKDLDISLDCDTACIIGQGNVALDCARILLRPSNLEQTDITSYAQRTLAKSRIKKIYIIGRRGPLQVAFTTKELRELIKLNEGRTYLDPVNVFDDCQVGLTELKRLQRHRQRISELLLSLRANGSPATVNDQTVDSHMECIFKFFSKPCKINSDPTSGRVNSLELQRTVYKEKADFLSKDAHPFETDQFETIKCGLIIRSIGYKAIMLDKNLPSNKELGAILNTNGRVHGHKGLYCSGWLATGASGVIAGTLVSSQTAAQSILEDFSMRNLPSLSQGPKQKPGFELVSKILRAKSKQVVHFNDWLRIDKLERQLGESSGKSREKLVDVEEMLRVARGDDDSTDSNRELN